MRIPPVQVANRGVIPRSTGRGGEPLSGLLTSHCGHRAGVRGMSICGSIWCPVLPGPLGGGMGPTSDHPHPKRERRLWDLPTNLHLPLVGAAPGHTCPRCSPSTARGQRKPPESLLRVEAQVRAVSGAVGAVRAGGIKAGPRQRLRRERCQDPRPGGPSNSSYSRGRMSLCGISTLWKGKLLEASATPPKLWPRWLGPVVE